MKGIYLAAAAAVSVMASAAGAQTVSNTSLQNINGDYGANHATTTTDANGTRTTVTGTASNRAGGTPVAGAWYQDNIGAGTTVGITTDYAHNGTGSAYFNSTQGANGKADLIYYFGGSVALSSLNSVSFDFYRSSASTADANDAPVLRLDMYKGASYAGSLVLENVYQHQTISPVDTWTTLTSDLNNGIWWATNAQLGPTFAAADGGQKTLAQWIAANPGLTVFGVELGIGSGWAGTFSGAADNVNVSFNGGPTISSNFEVAATAPVPEPASWALMIVGVGGIGFTLRRRHKGAVRATVAA